MTKKRSGLGSSLMFAVIGVTSSSATAQSEAADAAPAPTPAPDAARAPDASQPPAVEPAAAEPAAAEPAAAEAPVTPATEAAQPAACIPSCRSGFTCVSGVCVSACNPPCAAADVCSASGECINPEAEERRSSVRRHDGLYARLELGVGYFSGARVEERFDEDLEGDVTGVAQVGGLMLGGTVAPGLVLGGGVWGANAPGAEYSGDVLLDEISGPLTFTTRTANIDLASTSILGPFLAWYPDPTGGFNAELGVGFAVATLGDYIEADDFEIDDFEGGGWGLQLGAGYDFWIGEQWSLGLLGRVTYVNVGVTGDTNSLSAWVPALAAAVTYH